MLILVSHRRVQGWDSDAIAEDHRMCYFAGLWNSLDVAMEGGAPGPSSCQRSRFWSSISLVFIASNKKANIPDQLFGVGALAHRGLPPPS